MIHTGVEASCRIRGVRIVRDSRRVYDVVDGKGAVMKVLELCRQRHSVRSFTGEPISDEDRLYLMEAARWAATSGNRQARRFVVIQDPLRLQRLVEEASMQDFVADVGMLVFGVATTAGNRGAVADVFISMTQMELAAVERGLGTIWLGRFDREVVPRFLGVPDGMDVVMGLAFGHACGKDCPREKLPVEDLFTVDHL